MKFLLVFVCCVLIPSTIFACDDIDELWKEYKMNFSKSYSDSTEEAIRKKYFEDSWRVVKQHNLEADQGKHSWYMGLNDFSVMSPEELERFDNACVFDDDDESPTDLVESPKWSNNNKKRNLPKAVDWRKKNVLPPIKKQGPCGSCWAFGAVGALEAQVAKKKKKVVTLSEQNIVDCAPKKGDPEGPPIGCHGADITTAFEYIKRNGGINTEEYYPYEGEEGTCRFSKRHIGGKCKDYVIIRNSEEKVREAVATIGPVAATVYSKFHGYHGKGIFHSEECMINSNYVNHAVVIVGYGEENGKEYWIIRNSWGPNWGKEGYMYIARNAPFMCNIGRYVAYPVL